MLCITKTAPFNLLKCPIEQQQPAYELRPVELGCEWRQWKALHQLALLVAAQLVVWAVHLKPKRTGGHACERDCCHAGPRVGGLSAQLADNMTLVL